MQDGGTLLPSGEIVDRSKFRLLFTVGDVQFDLIEIRQEQLFRYWLFRAAQPYAT